MSLADIKRNWLLKQLGISASTLSENDLLTELYSNQLTAEMEGSGSPESSVTAPVGSTYIDRNAVTGAVVWYKFSGTGNTGWRVIGGDTGWRNVSSLIGNGWAGSVHLRRINNNCQIRGQNISASGASGTQVLTLPAGFIPDGDITCRAVALPLSLGKHFGLSGILSINVLTTSDTGLSLDHNYPVSSVWPSVLPGVSS